MARNIQDDALQKLIQEGLSQNEIARRTGIPRSTLRRRLEKLGTPQVDESVPQSEDRGVPTVHYSPPLADEIITELTDMLEWWRVRKHAIQTEEDAEQETQRQTYHVQKRYIEAIKRAADLERVSIMEIVNRAFAHYFNREHN